MMNAPDDNHKPTPAYDNWRQGSFLLEAALVSLGLIEEAAGDTIGIVISHDCDINAKPDRDPQIEIILGKPIPAMEYALQKSPRILDLEVGGNDTSYIRVEVAGKRSVSKDSIPVACLDESKLLDATNLRVLTKWLAARYRRSAFPSSFEDRIDSKLFGKIQKLVDKKLPYLQEILFRVDDNGGQERSDDELHTLGIVVVYKSFDDQEDRSKAERMARELVNELKELLTNNFFNKGKKDWEHIELEYCESTSIGGLTYQYFLEHQPWRLENVSRIAEAKAGKQKSIPVNDDVRAMPPSEPQNQNMFGRFMSLFRT